MPKINWNEYKEFKKHRLKDEDNFTILLHFIKSYYNVSAPVDIFNMLNEDELAVMMLQKRDISDAEGLETYLFMPRNG